MGCSTSKNVKTSGPQPEQATLNKARRVCAEGRVLTRFIDRSAHATSPLQVPADVASGGKTNVVSNR